MNEGISIRPFVRERSRPTLSGEFVIGFDCGQAQDFSAISVLRKDGIRYEAVHLERLPLNMSYPKQLEHLYILMNRAPLGKAEKTLCIDYTGVGRPVVDLAEDRGLNPVGLTITSGNSVTWNEDRTRVSVPKRDLIALMQVYAQNDKLKAAPGLRFGSILVQELESFRVKINPQTAHDSYSAWREGDHDDLILSVAIALWTAEHRYETERAPGVFVHRLGSATRRRYG